VFDSLLFVNGVERYSLAETRPHWPGYPVYIWIGKLVALFTGDATRALHLVSAVASSLVAWPLGVVARAWALSIGASGRRADWSGWGAAALWLVTPASWVTGNQIASDPLGLLCGAMLLVLCLAGDTGKWRSWLAAAALGGVMLGVRLVNFTMLGPLLAEAWRRRRQKWGRLPAALALAVALGAGAAPWMAWLAVREKGQVVATGRRTLTGHFTRWGGSVLTDPTPLGRPLRAARTWALYGLGAGSPRDGWTRLVGGCAWAAVLAAAVAQRPWRGRVARVVALWAIPHLAYVFIVQEVELQPRYMLSAAAVSSLLAGLAAAGRRGRAAVAVAVAVTAAVSGPLAVRQRRQPPAEYRVARFLAAQPRAALLMVGAPDLVAYVKHAAPNVVWRSVPATEVAQWQARWAADGRTVFATAPPEPDPSGWRPVAHFCRDPLIDPIHGRDLWVFAPASTKATSGDGFAGCEP